MYVSCDYASPIGVLCLVAQQNALVALLLKNDARLAHFDASKVAKHVILQQAQQQLDEYFQGLRQNFTVPLAPQGTPFQQKCWQALTHIPYGQTRSYQQQAQMIQQPKACRAVGGANAKNPILIMIPCHRVIGASGQLVGFSSGIENKKFLLRHEQQVVC